MLACPGDGRGWAVFACCNSGLLGLDLLLEKARTHTRAHISHTPIYIGVHFLAVISRLHLASLLFFLPPFFISVFRLCRLSDLEPLLSQCFIGSPRGVFTMGAPPPLCPPRLLVLHLQTHKHANTHALAGVHTQHSALILVINQPADRSIVNRNAFQC